MLELPMLMALIPKSQLTLVMFSTNLCWCQVLGLGCSSRSLLSSSSILILRYSRPTIFDLSSDSLSSSPAMTLLASLSWETLEMKLLIRAEFSDLRPSLSLLLSSSRARERCIISLSLEISSSNIPAALGGIEEVVSVSLSGYILLTSIASANTRAFSMKLTRWLLQVFRSQVPYTTPKIVLASSAAG